jgi:hypothetical protein
VAVLLFPDNTVLISFALIAEHQDIRVLRDQLAGPGPGAAFNEPGC